MRAPRASARSSRSSTRKADPSPITNPWRPTSNGREAWAGWSWRPERAPIRAKAAMAMGTTTASAPPARTTSAVPSRIRRAPSPTAWVPAAQAVATQTLGPVQPSSMATIAGVAVGIIIGTRNDVTRVGPRSMSTFSWSSSVARPPMPTPGTAPHGPPPVRCASGARSCVGAQLAEHERQGLADRVDAVEVLFGDGDVEPFLEGHDELDEVKAVGVEVLLEPGLLGHCRRVDGQ